MPVLICDLRAEAAALAPEYELLQEAGESLALLWLKAALPAASSRFVPVADPSGLQSAWEGGRLAVIRSAGWLPMDEFERCLVVGDPEGAAELACARALLAAGAEAVELLAPGATRELAQSWRSGRRTGARILRA